MELVSFMGYVEIIKRELPCSGVILKKGGDAKSVWSTTDGVQRCLLGRRNRHWWGNP